MDMVAIVTGNGLGLERSSATALGSRGQLGSAFLGRNNEAVTVNAATGNLVIQNTDEVLIGRGPDAALNRTYNSLGAYANLAGAADPDNWLVSTQRTVKLTGAANAAGSTATLTDWDGSVVVFAFDTASSSYKSSEPSYRNQRIVLSSSTFTQTDVSTQIVQTFDNAIGGRIVSAADADGNTVTYTYDAATTAGKLTRVTTANSTATQFNYTDLAYTGTNLTALTTSYYDTVSATNKTLTRTRYTYDTASRLSTVSVDLTPANTADTVVYTTTYGYKDATSKLVTSIAQSDGTSFAITYDASNRVTTVVQTAATGVTRTTAFTYDTANRVTTVTDPLSNVYKLTYDTSNRLNKVEEPAPTGGNPSIRTFEYDAAGNMIRALTFDNAANVGTAALAIDADVGRYDTSGNLLERVDGANPSVAYTYGAFNEVLSETTYTGLDANGLADNVAPTGAMTIRYVYDDGANNLFNDDGTTYTGTNVADVAERHLRFRISAEGRVTEYRDDPAGQLTAQIDYTGTAYTGATWTEAALGTWVATADKAQAQRTDYIYDFRGNLSTSTAFSATDSTGAGATAQDWSRLTYVYDQFGKLLSKLVSGANALGGEATAVAETYVYDGLGRVVSSTDVYGQTTTVAINDGTRTTTISTPNDVTHALVYNIAGELLSDAVSGTGVATGTTTYAYDNLGRLRMSTDPLGVNSYFVYDKQNRLTATIDGDGSMTEYRYDGADRRIAAVSYAALVSTASLTTLGTATANTEVATIRPTASTADRWTWSIYDKAGNLAETIDAAGAVIAFAYDGAGRPVGSTQYATVLAAATVNGADGLSGYRSVPPTAQVLPAANATNDRANRSFYDNDGLPIGTLDGDGYLTESCTTRPAARPSRCATPMRRHRPSGPAVPSPSSRPASRPSRPAISAISGSTTGGDAWVRSSTARAMSPGITTLPVAISTRKSAASRLLRRPPLRWPRCLRRAAPWKRGGCTATPPASSLRRFAL
jgi:YD repeat-containing protein